MSTTEIRPVVTDSVTPSVDTLTSFAWWTATVLRTYLGSQHMHGLHQWAEDRIDDRSRPYGPGARLEVPRLDAGSITPEEFQKVYVKHNSPVVLTGLAKDWPAVKTWSPEFFRKNYGHERVPARIDASSVTRFDFTDMAFGDLIDSIVADGVQNGTGLENICNRNPELRQHLDLQQLARYACFHKAWDPLSLVFNRIISTQIFISGRKGCTGMHTASGVNMFVMVHGRKKWTMVHPRHTMWMHTNHRNNAYYWTSELDHRKSDAEIAEAGFKLYQYIPKYETVLDPGDVLYVPQWWWHAVDNLSTTIGVATRTMVDLFQGNTVYSAMSTFSRPAIKTLLTIIKTGWGNDNLIDYAAEGWGHERHAPVKKQQTNSVQAQPTA